MTGDQKAQCIYLKAGVNILHFSRSFLMAKIILYGETTFYLLKNTKTKAFYKGVWVPVGMLSRFGQKTTDFLHH